MFTFLFGSLAGIVISIIVLAALFAAFGTKH